ncbi:MAG TPA: alkaline phosphatase family protein [bacterium]|nr:alkaline phosphatase family protein [bacterium]
MKRRKIIKSWAKEGILALTLVCLLGPGSFGRAGASVDFISTASEQGSPAFHHHLVRPGAVTTYIIEVANRWQEKREVRLEISNPKAIHWSARLLEGQDLLLDPGARREVTLEVRPAPSVKEGETCRIEVKAIAAGGDEDVLAVTAETTLGRKLYFISIDSIHPSYLELNAAGTGMGRKGDWLTPNLHRFMERAVFYPHNKVHIITATDMNHFNYLAGTMTGTSGIALVGGFFFGFDGQGDPIIKSAAKMDDDLARYGNGEHVDSLMNVAKRMNPQAWTAFVAGKNWVPELMRRPEFAIDRIIHGQKTPEYIEPLQGLDLSQGANAQDLARIALPGPLPAYAHPLGNPAFNQEPQDKRHVNSALGRLISSTPQNFPPDIWVMDAGLKEIANEDPDVLYILLAAVDDAGHAFGSAFDLNEWNDRGTPDDVTDDVSKYNPHASRQGILNVVREADLQFGRFLDALERRKAIDEAIIVVESDHAMVTHYRRAINMSDYLRMNCKRSSEKDYFAGSATSIGMVAARRDDPEIIKEVEAALESWQVKNPLTGQRECPVVVYNREEMKTGIDAKTNTAWMLPREYYSEYYVERRQPGDQVWADLLVLTGPNYEFRLSGFGLGNLGAADLPFKLPEVGYFIGGHGSFDTRAALLMLSIPGGPPAVNDAEVYAMDVAPTLYRLLGWPIPDCVDGKGLPGVDPSL